MKIFKLFSIFLFVFALQAEASSPYVANPDSAKYKWIKGKKFILHKVRTKETWNSVAAKYKISIADLMRSNLGVIDIKVGQILNVPSEKGLIAVVQPENTNKVVQPESIETKPESGAAQTPIHYVVKPGETLYGVSKKFNVSVEELKKLNTLESDALNENQRLIVGFMSLNSNTKTSSEVPVEAKNPPADYSIENKSQPIAEKRPQVAQPDTKTGETTAAIENPTRVIMPMGKSTTGKKLSQVVETGICSWIMDNDVNQSKFYALHRSAPIGTIIKVTNKMNTKHVFVKVVGLLPNTGDNENSIIKISEAAVKKLGALDAHFLAELSYGIMQ